MADIQQWRRKIQPARTRTPAVEYEEADNLLAPTTPKKGLKPKFSSYFTQHANNAGISKKESLSPRNEAEEFDWPSWPTEDPYPSPEADVLIDSVMCRILASPYEGLHARFNGVLLQIFEGFRSLSDEKQRLLATSEQHADRLSAMERVMQKSAQQWNQEKQEYKAEIKRLEVLLSKGQRGLAEVTLARQDSVLRARQAHRNEKARKHDTLETIFQFMEKSKKVEEKVWSHQRATMRCKSPSADMRRLSKTLMSQPTFYAELPPGTLTEGPSTLAEASFLENRSMASRSRNVSDPKTSFSGDDTTSTFSCAGDLLPDESVNAQRTEAVGADDDDDFTAIKRIAEVLAKRRNVDIEVVVPKLSEMFAAQPLGKHLDSGKTGLPAVASAVGHSQPASAPPTRKNTKLMAKASGFFHKLKSHSNVEAAVEERRFSFEAGDDSVMSAMHLDGTSRALSSSALTTIGAFDKVLRKSASTPLLADYGTARKTSSPQQALSPVAQSPTGSTPVSESRRGSKIPTPIHTPGTLARPRQEREGSESSLLTAIRYSENADRRSSSLSSSSYSSPSTSRMDLTAGSHASTSHRLLEHTKSLRGTALAAAAAVKAIENRTVDQASFTAHERRPIVQKADMSEYRKENARPMDGRGGQGDHEDLH